MLCRYLLSALAFVFTLSGGLATAQPAEDTIAVKATGVDVSFYDLFDFQPASSTSALPSGVLKSGGFQAYVIVRRFVTETRVREVPYTVYRIVNGRLVAETLYRSETYTVSKPVYETQLIDLPAANGTWYGLSGPQSSVWLISAVTPTGVKIGFGVRNGTNATGFVTLASFPGFALPSGTYVIESTTDEPGPAEETNPCE